MRLLRCERQIMKTRRRGVAGEGGVGGGQTPFSMMTSFSGINEVAQQLCVEPLIQLTAILISLVFPLLKYRGSVSYQAMSCIPPPPSTLAPTPISMDRATLRLSFIKPRNGCFYFLSWTAQINAGLSLYTTVTLKTMSAHTCIS